MRLRALLAAAVVAGSLALPAQAAACPNAARSGRWTTITPPGDAGARHLAVVPASRPGRPDVLVVSTLRTLTRSVDGGCTWSTMFSLDTDTAPNSYPRTTPTVQWRSLSVSGERGGARTLYALAVNTLSDVSASLPVMTAVSTDGGSRWRLHEPPTGPALAEYPACTATSTVVAGPDPKVAHLACSITSLSEVWLTLFGPQCRSVFYVTADAGTSWRAVTSRFWDPERAAAGSLMPCADMTYANTPVAADPVAPHVLWQLPVCAEPVFRSADDGATATVYARLPSTFGFCGGYGILPGTLKGHRSTVLVACGVNAAYLVTKPGSYQKAGPIPLRASEFGSIRGCAFDTLKGQVIAFYFDGEYRPRVFAYDIARRSWRSLGFTPPVKNGRAWDDLSYVTGVVSPATGSVYITPSSGAQVYRLAL